MTMIFYSYLALLSMLGFVATDMYLPAFKAIEISLATSSSNIASTLTFFLAGLAIGQLLYGPLVQHWGKRNSLLFGLTLFAIASMVIATTDSIVVFNLGRFLQAIGACSASVIWQAIVIDKFDENKAQKVFSNIMPLVALSPALAPIIGAYVLEHTQWNVIFGILFLLAVLLVIATLFFIDSSSSADLKQEEPNKTPYISMLINPKYIGNVLIFGGCSAAFFSYLTLWPIVMEQHGYQSAQIGLSFIPQTVMFIVGGYFSQLLITRWGTEKSLTFILLLFNGCVTAIAISTLIFRSETIWPMLWIFSLLAAANGACYPIVVNCALQVFKHASAKAAALQNFIQISMAFIASSLVAIWAEQGKEAVAIAMLICAVIVIFAMKVRTMSNWHWFTQRIQESDPAK